MGSTHQAHCECGFKADVAVGGSRRADEATFPFYCDTCGLVAVNVAKVEMGELAKCPNCNGLEVHQYGKSPASIPFIEPPPPGFISLFSDQLAEWASKIGIKLPFGRVREVGPKRPLRGRVTTAADGNQRALQWEGHVAFALDNLCPACKRMTLIFEPMPSVLFD